MSKHMFAGASSPIGFVDFFDNIMSTEKVQSRFFLKGSSGSGKSTFMKKIATALEAEGLEVERFHCANDAESLDAVANYERGICFIDATFPHSHDPQMPIITDKIIDFSQFIDKDKVSSHRAEITLLTRAKKSLSEKAAGYFAALGKIYNADKVNCKEFLINQSVNKLTKEWSKIFRTNKNTNNSINRKLFLSAVTPDGLVSFADDFFSECTVYGIFTEHIIGIGEFLEQMKDEANNYGMFTNSFYNPFDPKIIEHLHIPEINTAFVTIDGHFGYSGIVAEKIDLTQCINRKFANHNTQNNNELFNTMLNEVIDLMKASRDQHFKIEQLYSGSLDYERVDELTERTIRDILL